MPNQVIDVPDGEDVNFYASLLETNGKMILALSGSYTLVDDSEANFANTPVGSAGSSTVIDGNGATVTGGDYGLNFIDKSYIEFKNIDFVDQASCTIVYDGCAYIVQRDNTYVSHIDATFNDVNKIYRSDDCYWYDCTILATTAHFDSSDGFELCGPCNRMTFENCVCNEIEGPDPGTNINHGFEIYGSSEGEECDDVVIRQCSVLDCDAGVIATGEGAGNPVMHTNITIDQCTFTRCKRAIVMEYGSTLESIAYSDYNAFIDCDVVGSIGGTDYTTLAEWQAATGLDLHSTEA